MKIISICSGGLDSVSYTAKFVQEGHDVTILFFDYGQKAIKEKECIKEIFKDRVKIKEIDITFMKNLWPNTQLTDDTVEVKDSYTQSVVVPLRNAIFTTIATAYGYSVNADMVILGSHADDITIFEKDFMFPDCSPRFFESLETTLHQGHFLNSKKVQIMSASREGIGKKELVKRGYRYLKDDIFKTWSCYLSGEKQCGKCDSCNNRKKAFTLAKIEDKTEYAK